MPPPILRMLKRRQKHKQNSAKDRERSLIRVALSAGARAHELLLQPPGASIGSWSNTCQALRYNGSPAHPSLEEPQTHLIKFTQNTSDETGGAPQQLRFKLAQSRNDSIGGLQLRSSDATAAIVSRSHLCLGSRLLRSCHIRNTSYEANSAGTSFTDSGNM